MGNCNRKKRNRKNNRTLTPKRKPLISTMIGDDDYVLKVLFIGNASVGKTSLLVRFTENTFTPATSTILGVDMKSRRIVLPDGTQCKLKIWDTAGQERFRTITSSFYRGANIIFVVFDMTSRDSFGSVRKWLQEIERYACEEIYCVLVANKSDLVAEVAVEDWEIEELATTLVNVAFHIKTSALSGDNVDTMFTKAAVDLIEWRMA